MLGWWYGQGWLWILKGIENRVADISRIFAVDILIKTWFAPWKQIYSPSTFLTFWRSLVDNAISRVIGGVVRTGILFCALILAVLTIAIGLVILVVWPLLPAALLVLPVLTVMGAAAL
jgi:hypothetical protein